MTRKDRNLSYDHKTGSADERTLGQEHGLPGASERDAERAAAALAGERAGKGKTIPEQEGCGPNVTDYPGMSD